MMIKCSLRELKMVVGGGVYPGARMSVLRGYNEVTKENIGTYYI